MEIQGTFNLTVDDPIWSQSQTRRITLDCNTASQPTVINLPEIQEIYDANAPFIEIFINDFANNASANNITLNAGGSDVIDLDGQTSATIDQNGGSIILQVGTSGKWFAIESESQGGGATTFIGLTDTPNSYAGEASKIPVVNDLEDALTYKLASEAGYQYRFETTLNEAQILTMGTSPVELFPPIAGVFALDYKVILVFKMNGSTGNFGGVNLQGIVLNTSFTYPTIGQNQVSLINEAFIADGIDGSVVVYGQSSALVTGFELITPVRLSDNLSISTTTSVNPSNGGSDTANCTLKIVTLLNLIS